MESVLNTEKEVLAVLDEVLSLKGRSSTFKSDTPLLGAVPELDSMAVVTVITMLEERFGFVVDDDELDGQTFETIGTLVAFVNRKR
jgi:acyl carrier protein